MVWETKVFLSKIGAQRERERRKGATGKGLQPSERTAALLRSYKTQQLRGLKVLPLCKTSLAHSPRLP